ncbi:MAG: DUF6125 family protein [Dehalococcoidia bacterium]|nr:DUF6125 family protein [Dehalococcoidia bacterium]
MAELSDRQIADFFRRSYTAVDGLWFVKAEDKHGFEAALDLDDEVWKVFPKVQARMLKEMTGLTFGLEALRECFTTKLAIEGFRFDIETLSDGFRVSISRCPWHDAMVKSGREALSGKVGTRICRTEYTVWAAEFGQAIRFRRESEICSGSERCVLEFSR